MNEKAQGARNTVVPWLLAAVMILEFVCNRVGPHVFRPTDPQNAGTAWLALGYASLFFYYLSLVVSNLVMGLWLWQSFRGRLPGWRPRPADYVQAILLGLFIASAFWCALAQSFIASLFLSGTFVLALSTLVGRTVLAPGVEWNGKIGVVLWALPLLVSVIGFNATHLILGEETNFSDLPRLLSVGTVWLMCFAAIATPYCFIPRPAAVFSVRLWPWVISAFFGLLCAVVIRFWPRLALVVIHQGFGVELGRFVPPSQLILFLLAITGVVWLVTATMAGGSERRNVGISLVLILLAGSSNAWPAQFCMQMAGFMLLGHNLRMVSLQRFNQGSFVAAGQQLAQPNVSEQEWFEQGSVAAPQPETSTSENP